MMNNTPWVPYTPNTLPKEGGYYLTYMKFPHSIPSPFVPQIFRNGSFRNRGVVAYLEIPPVPQEFKYQ